MEGAHLRDRRQALGWSQAELASRVGVSQPMISSLERGRRSPSPELGERLERVLGAGDAPRAHPQPAPALPLEIPAPHDLPPGHRLPISVSSWLRPEQGGDGLVVAALGDDAWLLAAIDLAGHGRRLYGKLQYVRGWLRGWASSQSSVPTVYSIATALEEELAASRIEAGWYVAVLQSLRPGGSLVRYAALTSSYPQPLLVEGAEARVMPSASPWGAASPGTDLGGVALEAPWRLLISSDGLLSRLGGGDERHGLQRLRRWLRGIDREQPLADALTTKGEIVDDESAFLVQSRGHAAELALNAADRQERHRAVRWIENVARGHVSEEDVSRVGQSVLEALINARDHGYAGEGIVILRVHVGGSTFAIQIRDHGRGRVRTNALTNWEGGIRIMRGFAQRVDVWENAPPGTVVTLTFTASSPDGETNR